LCATNVESFVRQIGYPAPRHRSTTTHSIVGGVARSGMSYVDLRFQLLDEQVRDGSYPLHMASMSKNTTVSVIRMLLDAAPEVITWINKYGDTPLHVALASGASSDVIQTLMAHDTKM
jgi:ankyrin repeat protein